jgi:hypothetical protein
MSNTEREHLQRLDSIIQRLDVMIGLLIPPSKSSTVKLGKLEQAVYSLCDMQHTRRDMAASLNKTLNLIDVTLNGLKNKGLVKPIEIEDRTCYIRLKG